MVITIISILVFCVILCFLIAIQGILTRSKVEERIYKQSTQIATSPFLESLWNVKGSASSVEKNLQTALIAGGAALILGSVFSGLFLGMLLGIIAFAFSPKVEGFLTKRRFSATFEDQFSRVMATFSASAKVNPLRSCFGIVADEFKDPVASVFYYIQNAIEELNYPPYKAVMMAAKEFNLPILEYLAEAVRLLDEVGGGENSAELLDSVAEEVRFMRRHRLEVKSLFGELQMTMLMATGIPVVIFILFAMDKTGAYYYTLKEYPIIIVAGAVILAIGWIVSKKIMNNAAKTL